MTNHLRNIREPASSIHYQNIYHFTVSDNFVGKHNSVVLVIRASSGANRGLEMLKFMVTVTVSHLSGWNFMPYVVSQVVKLFRSFCTIFESPRVLISLYTTKSYAKSLHGLLIVEGRSLIKTRNRTGPRTVPWGTPESILHESEASSSTRVMGLNAG